jgi:hypothetical protein
MEQMMKRLLAHVEAMQEKMDFYQEKIIAKKAFN